ATNTSSIPEVTGDSAILFEPFNVEELQKSILKIVKNTDLKNKLKNDGISRAKQFSWHKCAEETLNVYKKVLNG
ncbi:glycosyltransferase family 1 protein, partial [Candidatus Desantisbacteria bacterium]|nr:glycosyltransferase family 1 protein [Candidatus Desantisbacteria bacterium]